MTIQNSILRIDSSARKAESTTRQLTSELIKVLRTGTPDSQLIERDVSTGLPFVDEDWVAANFTAEEDRTPDQREKLSFSDSLVHELQEAETVVIGLPVYNFGIPAALKAWVDMIARARLTFRYTPDGPEGLLNGKRVFLVVASGGTPVGSDIDFATSYMRQVLQFVGITDVTIIDASAAASDAEAALDRARGQIASASRGRVAA